LTFFPSKEVVTTNETQMSEVLDESQQCVLNMVRGVSLTLDQIEERSGLSATAINGALLGLEIKGLVVRFPGGSYQAV
jgi:predicted Rossmann fold nucleotide-binding protein DprA/Smf involved in DNA uptake